MQAKLISENAQKLLSYNNMLKRSDISIEMIARNKLISSTMQPNNLFSYGLKLKLLYAISSIQLSQLTFIIYTFFAEEQKRSCTFFLRQQFLCFIVTYNNVILLYNSKKINHFQLSINQEITLTPRCFLLFRSGSFICYIDNINIMYVKWLSISKRK